MGDGDIGITYPESRRDGMSVEKGSINQMSPVGTECLYNTY